MSSGGFHLAPVDGRCPLHGQGIKRHLVADRLGENGVPENGNASRCFGAAVQGSSERHGRPLKYLVAGHRDVPVVILAASGAHPTFPIEGASSGYRQGGRRDGGVRGGPDERTVENRIPIENHVKRAADGVEGHQTQNGSQGQADLCAFESRVCTQGNRAAVSLRTTRGDRAYQDSHSGGSAHLEAS